MVGDFGEQAPENDLGASPLNSLNLIHWPQTGASAAA